MVFSPADIMVLFIISYDTSQYNRKTFLGVILRRSTYGGITDFTSVAELSAVLHHCWCTLRISFSRERAAETVRLIIVRTTLMVLNIRSLAVAEIGA